MKLCPTCQRTYEDDALRFCLEDGTALVDTAATMKIPSARVTSDAPTEVMGEDRPAPRAERKYEAAPAAVARKSSAAPWILGAAVVLGLSAIAVAFIMTRGGANNTEVAQSNLNVNSNASPLAEVEPERIPRGDNSATPTRTGDGIGSGSGPGLANKTPERPTPAPSPRQTPTERPTPPPPTPEATATARPPTNRPISGGVLNGKAISLPRPVYPAIARTARASGTVTVQVTVDESGKVISARAVAGHPLLQQSAVQAAYGARFSPTQLSGQPVKVTGVLTYNFIAQ